MDSAGDHAPEVIDQVRRCDLRRERSTAILVMVNRTHDEVNRWNQDPQVDAVLRKPFSLRELRQKLQEHVSQPESDEQQGSST